MATQVQSLIGWVEPLRRLRNSKGLLQDYLAYDALVTRSYLSQQRVFYTSLKIVGRIPP